MSDIKTNIPDLFELQNTWQTAKGDEDAPVLLLESGVWHTQKGEKSGISVSVFGDIAPLVEPRDAIRLAKWLLAAAEALSGEKHQERRNGQKKRRHYDDDE